MARSIFFRAWSRMEITRALALHVFGSTKPENRRSWKGLVSLLNRKPTMNADPVATTFLLIVVMQHNDRPRVDDVP